MTRFTSLLRPILLLLLVTANQAAAPGAKLQPETIQAFDRQVAAVDQSSKERIDGHTPFLWATSSAGRRQRLLEGDLVIAPRHGKGDIPVEKGIVHHWIGCVFVPNRHAADALTLLRDFDSYKLIYPGSVVESKALQRNGDTSQAYLRLRKHRMVTVVLNSEYDVRFARIDDRRAYSRSLSTRIAQVENPGTPEEQELQVGDDSGFLWRIVTVWRLEEADGGVYLECEVLALTRGIPYGLGWLIRPIIRSFPRESLAETLNDTRSALLVGHGSLESPRSLSRGNQTKAPVKPIEASLP
jgi:hypothetical protein